MRGLRSFIIKTLTVTAVILTTAALFCMSATQAADNNETSSPGEMQSSGAGMECKTEWSTCGGGADEKAKTWYMAEGCTAEGYETWILILNAETDKANVTLEFVTSSGQAEKLITTIEPMSRVTVNVADKVPGNYNVSTVAESDIPIVCERAMYAPDRDWANSSMGATQTSTQWYMAEGCTRPSYETWLLILNPGETEVAINSELQTFSGEFPGPVDTIPPGSRRSYNLADYAPGNDVATLVNATGGVVCERSMYASNRDWAHSSVGTTDTSTEWYFAEGCSAGDYQTWILVQNPSSENSNINIEFQTENGPVQGPRDTVMGKERHSYKISDYVNTYNVSTKVSADRPVVCERAVYSAKRDWAHSNNGKAEPSADWYFAEGCTGFDFETWILVQNPSGEAVDVVIEYITKQGKTRGKSRVLAPKSRVSINLDEVYALQAETELNAADAVADPQGISVHIASSGPIVCERAMYGCIKDAMVKPVNGTPLYPFSREESIACGHWPSGSLDYPYFGAPRTNGRLHAGIDIYPKGGEGAFVYALKSGTVVRVEPFYTRYTGEVTYAVLIDHGDFVANYAELQPPSLKPGDRVERGHASQVIGYISGTQQLHFEMYTPGTNNWVWWYGAQPANLIDPTSLIQGLY